MGDAGGGGVVGIKARLEEAVSRGDRPMASHAMADLLGLKQRSVDRFVAENEGLFREACRLYFGGRGDVLNNIAVGFVTLNI